MDRHVKFVDTESLLKFTCSINADSKTVSMKQRSVLCHYEIDLLEPLWHLKMSFSYYQFACVEYSVRFNAAFLKQSQDETTIMLLVFTGVKQLLQQYALISLHWINAMHYIYSSPVSIRTAEYAQLHRTHDSHYSSIAAALKNRRKLLVSNELNKTDIS